MTQQDLADAAHVDIKTIYNLESGTRRPIARTRAAIAAALGWEGDALTRIPDGPPLTVIPGHLPPAGAPVTPGIPPKGVLTAEEEAAALPLYSEIIARLARLQADRGIDPADASGDQLYPDPADGLRALAWDQARKSGLGWSDSAWLAAHGFVRYAAFEDRRDPARRRGRGALTPARPVTGAYLSA